MNNTEYFLLSVQIVTYLACSFLCGICIAEKLDELKNKNSIYKAELLIEVVIANGEYQVLDTKSDIRYHIYLDKVLCEGDVIYVTYSNK